MDKKLFLLDGMALVYRAHFVFITRPILTSKGVNTSALYGFTQTLLDILNNQKPTHIAVAFDTEAPTHRYTEYADYKATRQVMPEDLSAALPHVRRMIEAFHIPVLTCDGFEADDIIGTLVQRSEKEGFDSFMVTPDKDFGQLITEHTFLYKPSRMGEGVEILGVPEIQKRWNIQRPEQVVDVLALMGDSSDNVPGVPGIGEKTAMKLIGQYETVENLLAHQDELTGKLKENLVKNQQHALLSKRLVTIIRDAPCPIELEKLKVQPPDEARLKSLLIEFEFNSIGRRLFGEEFKAGRGGGISQTELKQSGATPSPRDLSRRSQAKAEERAGRGVHSSSAATVENASALSQPDLVLTSESAEESESPAPTPPSAPAANLKTIADVSHEYHIAPDANSRAKLIKQLQKQKSFALDLEATSLDSKDAKIVGLAFSFAPHGGYYVPFPADAVEAKHALEEFRPVLEDEKIEKVGHNLKFDLSVLKWHGIAVGGKLFDTMVAHSLIEPDMRHGMDYMAEVYLGYTPIPITKLMGEPKGQQLSMADV